ncbi:MAG: Uma2 family endonuclease [Hyphomicrobiales bacterium]
MTTPAAEELERIDLILQSSDGPQYEFVGGELRERNVSTDSSEVALFIAAMLMNHIRPARLAKLFDSELGIRIFRDPMETRRASVSFVSAGRAPEHDTGFLRVAPDLVVEVVSPGDKASELRAKVTEWLANGVRLVWVAYPHEREIHVFRAGGESSIYRADQEISGEDVIPGFASKTRELFPS